MDKDHTFDSDPTFVNKVCMFAGEGQDAVFVASSTSGEAAWTVSV